MMALNLIRIQSLLGSFLLLTLIGLGPSLHLISRIRQNFLYALYLAPTIGFTLVALILYPLVLANIPVGIAAVPIALGTSIISIVLTTERGQHSIAASLRRIGQSSCAKTQVSSPCSTGQA